MTERDVLGAFDDDVSMRLEQAEDLFSCLSFLRFVMIFNDLTVSDSKNK